MNMIQLRYGQTSALVQTQGAQLASLKCADGREVIWQADPQVWAQHTPVLFPVCGSVRDGKIRIDGREYPMTKHGFTRTPEFAVCRRGADFRSGIPGRCRRNSSASSSPAASPVRWFPSTDWHPEAMSARNCPHLQS